jgi:hypothetical protein
MDKIHKEYLVNRVLSGEYIAQIGNAMYFLRHPTRTQRHIAQLKLNQAMGDFDFENALSKDQLLPTLVSNQLVPPDVDDKLRQLEKDLEKLKHNLYLNHKTNPIQAKSMRQALKMTKTYYTELTAARHCLDHLTIEGYAEMVKMQYLVSSCLYNEEDKLVDDMYIYDQMLVKLNQDRITNEDFREIARSEPWRSYWNANSDFVFGTPVADWTEDQKVLVLFSKMYDSAYKSQEPPEEYIINDDDLFDGWMTEQRKKYERDKKERDKDKKKVPGQQARHENADEIYVMVKDSKTGAVDKNLLKETEGMNSLDAKMRKKQRAEALDKMGVLREEQLPDVKRDLYIEAQQKAAERKRG